MSEDHSSIETLEDALAALKKVRKADEAKRKKIDALEEQIEATDGQLAALTAYEALGTPDDLKARLTSGDAALKALTDNGVTPEELPSIAKEAKEAAGLKRERDLTAAASAIGKPKDALTEILDGKTLSSRKETQEGQEVDVWGIGEGDAFKPLTELKAVQYLASELTNAPKPDVKPLPTGGAGGKPQPKTAADIRTEKATDAAYLI